MYRIILVVILPSLEWKVSNFDRTNGYFNFEELPVIRETVFLYVSRGDEATSSIFWNRHIRRVCQLSLRPATKWSIIARTDGYLSLRYCHVKLLFPLRTTICTACNRNCHSFIYLKLVRTYVQSNDVWIATFFRQLQFFSKRHMIFDCVSIVKQRL